jgi:hypothetical protein
MAGEKYSSSDNEVELDVGDAQEEEVEIEEESDVSEPDTSDSEDDRSEHERHTDGAQTRINRLTKKMREAERQKDEAIRFAQQVQQEAVQLKTRMKQLDTGYLTEYGGRLGMETAQAEAALKRAVEIGDSEAMVNAQRQLSQLYSAAEKYKQVKSQKENEAQYVQQPQQQQQQPQQQQQAEQQVRRPDVKAEAWAEKNVWFGQDEAMTFAAFGIHKRLVEDEGFDPQANEYYTELDRRLRNEFPHKLSGSSKRVAQTVAGVSRTNSAPARGTRKVRLTPTQVAIARKLGLTVEQYARYVKD